MGASGLRFFGSSGLWYDVVMDIESKDIRIDSTDIDKESKKISFDMIVPSRMFPSNIDCDNEVRKQALKKLNELMPDKNIKTGLTVTNQYIVVRSVVDYEVTD